MRHLLSIVILVALAGQAQAQATTDSLSPEHHAIDLLNRYLGLTRADFGFRNDYTEVDSFRLSQVSRLMASPLAMADYGDQLKNGHLNGQPEILARFAFDQLLVDGQLVRTKAHQADIDEIIRHYNLYYENLALNQLLTRAAAYIDVTFPRSAEKALAALTAPQKAFLIDQFKKLVVITDNVEKLSVEAIDSLDKIDEQNAELFAEFGYLIDKDPLLEAGILALQELMLEIRYVESLLRDGRMAPDRVMERVTFLPDNADRELFLGHQNGWRVGGPGNDYYSGDFRFIFDFGGDDVYDLSYDPSSPHGVIIIDLSGNDTYRGTTDFALGSGCLSVGLLIDLGGSDRYDAKSFSLGSGFFGLGLLYDAAGDDRYNGDTHVQGAGSFGIGLLIDEGGRDIYDGAVYCQGFGFVEGFGAIYDIKGTDSYFAGGKYLDILRYQDHFLSLGQGFGYGLRPFMSGGIGTIVDLEGNDTYQADIFAQAAAYWWSLGLIYDSSGNDSYNCFQYGQGAATHMALGALIENHGNDVYFGKGLMHGCGHDYSCGLILDRTGDDTYTAYDLSQGAGSANGIGIQIDLAGDDRYLVKNPANTQGYGNPRRDFGSIGLFIDMGGKDQYNGNGRDSHFWRTDSKWGGGIDWGETADSAEVKP